MNKIRERGNDYYRTEVELKELSPTAWIGRGHFCRKDTGEQIREYVSVRGDSKASILAALDKQIEEQLPNLPVPYDWGKPDKVRLVIQKYIRFNSQLTDACVALEKYRAEGTLSREQLHKFYHELRDAVTEVTLQLINTLGDFSEDEKIQLMHSDPSVYAEITDPWNLDDVYARDGLFKYIIAPTTEIIKAHDEHVRRMLKAFEANVT